MSTLLLKLIACTTMLVDHIGWFSFLGYPQLGNILRAFGRISFPIFAYLIAFGYQKTHSKYLYLLRLITVGCISEIPYNYCFINELSFKFNNVYFTLALGLISIIVYDLMISKSKFQKFALIPPILFALLASLIGTDYGTYGVLLIFSFHLYRNSKISIPILCALFSCRSLFDVLLSNLINSTQLPSAQITTWSKMQLFAVFATIPILCCDGSLGWTPKTTAGKKLIKYSFYVFYPLHLLVIGIVVRQFIMQ